MSYDIHLRPGPDDAISCPTCKRPYDVPLLPDPTYNLAPIFRQAFQTPEGIEWLHGKTGEETAEALREAYDRMCDPALRAAFVALQPPNRWGDLPGAMGVMLTLRQAALDYPTYVWEIS